MSDPTIESQLEDGSQDEVDHLLGEIATEFFERISQGESPRIEEYAERFPKQAPLIRQALAALQIVGESVDDGKTRVLASGTCGEVASATGTGKELGDFRIVGELGRGGMGVVYEAEQLSMGGRRVALKVLPFATMADPRRLQRFHNEVRAAGSLDHPNIVSVYSVGQDRGVHFYAMRLIRGQSMARLIQELAEVGRRGSLSAASIKEVLSSPAIAPASSGNTDPTEAINAEKPVEASGQRRSGESDTAREPQALVSTKGSGKRSDFCEAVADLGIQAAEALDHAHQRGVIHRDIKPANLLIDPYSQLFVADFGLAHIEEGVGMTMTGDLIGTLRYMSPEQAMGTRVRVDYRTDIYSLGVSLYELLTTQPAFNGENRAAILKQIAFEEPEHLTQVDPSIPKDLETIIHKAMAKSPDERYASAQEFADDLRAFRACLPIKAKPPTVVDRLRKFTRRNQGLVAAVMLLLLFSTIGLAISNSMIAAQRTAAEEARDAEKNQRQEADRHRRLAEENFQLARGTVEKYLTQVSEELLLNSPSMQPLRKRLLELALEYYQQFVDGHSEDTSLQNEVASAHYRLGLIAQQLGDASGAEQSLEKAFAIRKKLLEADSENEAYRNALAESYLSLHSMGQFNDGAKQVEFLGESIAMLGSSKQLANRKTLAATHMALGDLFAQFYHYDRRTEQMKWRDEAWKKAETLASDLHEQNPDGIEYGVLLAQTYLRIPGSADRGLQLLERLCEKHSDNLQLQFHLADGYQRAGASPFSGKEFNDIDLAKKSLAIRRRIAQENPAVTIFQEHLSRACSVLAQAYAVNGKLQEEISAREEGIRVLQKLVQAHPDSFEYNTFLGANYTLLADLKQRTGQPMEAIDHHQAAIAILSRVRNPYPLSMAFFFLASVQRDVGLLEDAIVSVQQSVDAMTEQLELTPGNLKVLLDVVEARCKLASYLREAGRPIQALRALQCGLAYLVLRKMQEVDSEEGIQKMRRLASECRTELAKCLESLNVNNDQQNADDLVSDELLPAMPSIWKSLPDLPHLQQFVEFDVRWHLAQLIQASEKSVDSKEPSSGSEALVRQASQILESLTNEPSSFLDCLDNYLHFQKLALRLEEAQIATRKKFIEELGQPIDRGLDTLRNQVEANPDKSNHTDWARLVVAIYSIRNWQGAEREGRLAAELAADQPGNLAFLAPLLLMTENDEYRRVCDNLLKRWRVWEGDDLGHAAALCSINPAEPEDPDALLRLAERAVAEGPDWSLLVMARTQYRLGNFQEAIERCEEIVKQDNQGPLPRYDLALAHHYAGNHEKATRVFNEAEKLAETWTTPWPNLLLQCEAIRQEARKKILLKSEVSN